MLLQYTETVATPTNSEPREREPARIRVQPFVVASINAMPVQLERFAMTAPSAYSAYN